MTWSIFKDTSSSNVDDWVPNYIAWYTDYDIETNHEPNRVRFLSDGPVNLYYKWNGREVSTIINVIDEKFDRNTIDKDIMNLVKHTGYWGMYVEGFYKHKNKLYVSIGS